MISSLPKKLSIFESVIVVHFTLVMCNDFFFFFFLVNHLSIEKLKKLSY